MQIKLFTIITCCLFTLFIGCAGKQHTSPNLEKKEITSKLREQYKLWQGVPYEDGGISMKGVDCSAFVQITYRDLFGLVLPRVTNKQSKQGIWTKRTDLQTGDLVFFRTGWFTKHVGIYLKKGEFIHASTTNGVSLSNLSEPYWDSRYWQARRLPLR